MMDGRRGPSRNVTTLRVFSALDLYIVFGSHDREAAVRSARPQAGQKLL
jgi:hypothetical protein